ncbi:collagen alpha-5(VI) chain-like [Physella acuta]|uniref:collagen alpha-5(VI) chain-like n=1 Tax=Physella acuta TaxID=109671 RepID=UPI0027DE73EA|nr:collagen alpha-5(VI) chain-like [Physella acuta]
MAICLLRLFVLALVSAEVTGHFGLLFGNKVRGQNGGQVNVGGGGRLNGQQEILIGGGGGFKGGERGGIKVGGEIRGGGQGHGIGLGLGLGHGQGQEQGHGQGQGRGLGLGLGLGHGRGKVQGQGQIQGQGHGIGLGLGRGRGKGHGLGLGLGHWFRNRFGHRQLPGKGGIEIEDFEIYWSKPILDFSSFGKEIQSVLKEKRKIYGDILLAIDASSGIEETNFRKGCKFAADFAKYFSVGDTSARFGALLFGDVPKKICSLGTFNNNKDVAREIYYAQRINKRRETNTHLALDLMIESNLFDIEAGGRADAPDILILIGGSKCSNKAKTLAAANRLKNRGVLIITVSVGTEGSADLQEISSSTSSFFSAVSFDGLWTIIVKIIERTIKVIITPEAPPAEAQCAALVDLFFVMDASGSIGKGNYKKQLQFVSNLIQPFTIGNKGAKVGALLFSTQVQKLFDLKTYTTKDAITKAILAAPYLEGSTSTDLALNYIVEKNVFGAASGGRANAKRVVVVLTDGRSNNVFNTNRAAASVKNSGVQIIAIGIAQAFLQELRAIASSNSDIFKAADFDALSSIRRTLSTHICETVNEVTDVGANNVEAPNVAVEPPRIPLPDVPAALPPPVNPCPIKVDIIFCLDSSGSIGPVNYQLQLKFAAEIASNFPLGNDLAAIGSVIFSNTAEKVFDLKDYTKQSEVTEAILLTRYINSTTNTHLAFNLISEHAMFETEAGGRDDAAKIILFMTDGQSGQPKLTVESAERLKEQGVNIFSIGVGKYVLEELNSVASDAKNVFTVTGFNALDNIKKAISVRACDVSKAAQETDQYEYDEQ